MQPQLQFFPSHSVLCARESKVGGVAVIGHTTTRLVAVETLRNRRLLNKLKAQNMISNMKGPLLGLLCRRNCGLKHGIVATCLSP